MPDCYYKDKIIIGPFGNRRTGVIGDFMKDGSKGTT
jgi:hypothetical protein